MARATQLLTAEDLARIPDDGFHRYELVAGKLRTMSPPGSLHGVIVSRLTVAVSMHVDASQSGIVIAGDSGFKLESNPDTVRAPDVAFIARERIPPTGIPNAYWAGAPDLAVEVLSPGDRRSEVEEKIEQYLQLGVRLVWLVDAKRRRVRIHQPERPLRVLSESDVLDGGDLLPGFRYPLSRLFSFDL